MVMVGLTSVEAVAAAAVCYLPQVCTRNGSGPLSPTKSFPISPIRQSEAEKMRKVFQKGLHCVIGHQRSLERSMIWANSVTL